MMNDAEIMRILGDYGGTLCYDDVNRLKLLQNAESENKIDLSKFYPIVWGVEGLKKYENLQTLGPSLWNRPQPDDVLDLIDANLLYKSSRYFPLNLRLDLNDFSLDSYIQTLYDPRFFLPLFIVLLSPENVMDCKKFVRKNCLLFTFSCLSSHDVDLRRLAYLVLSKFRRFLDSNIEKSDEKSQLVYFLTLFRNSLEKPNVRLASIAATFLGRAASLIFNPFDRMYPLICSFLLLKPTIDLENVPEFYKFFHSSSLEFICERHWVLSLILDGLREPKDYRICEKRYVFKLLLSFYNCSLCDGRSKELIEKILKSACRINACVADLCFNHNLIGWIISNFRNDPEVFVSMTQILVEIGETLQQENEEKTLNALKQSWLTCFVVVAQLYVDENQRKIDGRSLLDKNFKERLLKIAQFILDKCLSCSFVLEIKKLIENFGN